MNIPLLKLPVYIPSLCYYILFGIRGGHSPPQFHLWFDPTKAFHTYSIVWNSQRIIVFRNLESAGVPFPKNEPMRIYSRLGNADDWATRGGLVKTNWKQETKVLV
ncbi:unnamed protein product [Malus baccata var. baccata]